MKKSMMRAAIVLSVALSLGFGVSSAFAAELQYLLGGNGRAQIGGGLPLPVTNTAPPNGRILPVAGAHVTQTTTNANPQIKIKPGMMRNGPKPEFAIGVFLNNPVVFSVQSNLGFSFPAAAQGTKTLSAGGRTGGTTTSFVPPGGIPGVLRYTATGNQFGGPARTSITGTAKVWIVAGASPPPCAPGPNCIAALVVAAPAPTAAAGGAFATAQNSTSPVAQIPGFFVVGANAAGSIYFRTPANSAPGLLNTAASQGGPWTTGQLTISQTAALGAPEIFTITGSDARTAGGMGNISLVSGALSTRTLSGPNANRSWFNLTIGAQVNNPVVPTLSPWSIALLVTLLGGTTVWMVRRAVTAS